VWVAREWFVDRVVCLCGAFAVVVGLLAGWQAATSRALASGVVDRADRESAGSAGQLGADNCVVRFAARRIALGEAGVAEHWNGVNWPIDQPLHVGAGVSFVFRW
jgi:hypothetical protein